MPFSYVDLFGFDCHRVHLGKFERGPIRFVVDGHNRADVPAACLSNATGPWIFAIVHLFLVNDTELASALQDQFGIPAAYAQIEAATQDTAALAQITWSWTIPGEATSKVTLTADSTTQPYAYSNRFFWERDDGVGALDITYPTRDGPTIGDRPAQGTMQPPMLLASQPQGLFAGAISYFPAMSGNGVFRLYSDTSCMSVESSS